MKSPLTTLCYIEKDDCYLLLHRIKKKEDVNKGKWIGVGGHFEEGESPEECLIREVREETGLTLTSWKFRGLITFTADVFPAEYMCLFTADGFEGELVSCNEGELAWIPKSELWKYPTWEGDKIFLRLLKEDAPFFTMKLTYEGDRIVQAVLNGKELELFDILREDGTKTGLTGERNVIHQEGSWHATVHTWLVRKKEEKWQVLLQKRSKNKDAYPGRYDISSAGHVQAGDEYLPSALRELEEELGVKAREQDLIPLGIHIGRFDEEFYGKPFHNREVSRMYLYFCDRPEEDFLVQEEEVESVCWMDLEEVVIRSRGEWNDILLEEELADVKKWLEAHKDNEE